MGFVELAEKSRSMWKPVVEGALARREVRVAVVDDTLASSLMGLQMVRIGTPALTRRGFRIVAETPRYTLLILRGARP